jgi:hypothetical protein
MTDETFNHPLPVPGNEAAKIKTVGGDPLRPRAAWEQEPTVVASAKVNADGELPKAKPVQPKVIGGVPADVPSATRQPGHPEPTVVTSGPAKA